MIVLPDRTVLLREGEAAPVECECGAIYQPRPGSADSLCPECGALNIHAQCPVWDLIEAEGE